MKPMTLGIALASALAACTAATTPGSTPTGTPTTPAGHAITADAYYQIHAGDRTFLALEVHDVTVADDPGLLERVREVVDGAPDDPDHFTGFNAEAEVRAVSLEAGVATVDWNAAALDNDVDATTAALAVQQVVWTLRAVPDVAAVRFTVEGKADGAASNGRQIEGWWGHFPINQAEVFQRIDTVLEPITILEPGEDDEVSGSVVVEGSASVFEGTVVLRLVDAAGDVLTRAHTTATVGAPGRGTFSKRLTLPDVDAPETWTIAAVEESAEDGGDFFVQTRSVTVVPA